MREVRTLVSCLVPFRSVSFTIALLALFSLGGSARADESANDVKGKAAQSFESETLSRFEANEPAAVTFSPDSSEILVVEGGFTPRFLRIETKSGKLKSETALDFACRTVAFSDDLKQVHASGSIGNVDVWAFESAKANSFVSKRRLGEIDRILGVVFSPNGKHLATSSSDRVVRLWDVERSEVLVQQRIVNTAHSVQFSSDGKRLLAVAEDGVYVFGLPELDVTFRLRRETKKVRYSGATFTKDAGGVFAWQGDGLVERWRLSDGKMIGTIKPPGFEPIVKSVLAHPAGDRIFVAVNSGGVYSYDVEGKDPPEIIQRPDSSGRPGELKLSADGTRLGLFTGGGGVVWDLGRPVGKR